ncbi:hypothetical protein SISNIDRAFT_497874 [Sistotremastrum niveocremeum HHB9708]|uniref:Uncharacterized protein n=1 Tax=Sistotremastrum niveocremeum HHB9708 TaxID=1314777 RepID=A0A164PBU5_9AGAM|nr:hypothetical protein SISNIDRAFT_497874 [Sistotremastrum niveocremeum HHB9708]
MSDEVSVLTGDLKVTSDGETITWTLANIIHGEGSAGGPTGDGSFTSKQPTTKALHVSPHEFVQRKAAVTAKEADTTYKLFVLNITGTKASLTLVDTDGSTSTYTGDGTQKGLDGSYKGIWWIGNKSPRYDRPQVTPLNATGLASVSWLDDQGRNQVRIYFQDAFGWVRELKWTDSVWSPNTKRCFKPVSLRTPLAAVAYPNGDGKGIAFTSDPEIHVFCIRITNASTLLEYVKKKGEGNFGEPVILYPSYLAPNSGLAAVALQDVILRVYWQDINNIVWESGRDTRTGNFYARQRATPGTSVALQGTPIAAAVGIGYEKEPAKGTITVAWENPDNTLAGATIRQTAPLVTPLTFPVKHHVSPSGSITILSWFQDKTIIYYDGLHQESIQKVTIVPGATATQFEGPFHSLTGNITTSNSPGQGILVGAAYGKPINGRTGSVFYQRAGQIDLGEVLL